MTVTKRCKACGAILDEQGICTRPCKLGQLQKQIAELKAKIERIKNSKQKHRLCLVALIAEQIVL